MLRLLGILFMAVLPASACPICMGSLVRQPCFAEKVILAEQLAIARPTGDGTFIIETRLRGEKPALGSIVTASEGNVGSRALIAFNDGVDIPENLGPYTTSLSDFLRIILPLRTFEPNSNTEWTRQLDRFRPFLDDRDPRVAGSAWTAWALSPYHVLRKHHRLPDRDTLLTWLDDETRSGEASLYWTLLGLQADYLVKDRLRKRILAAWQENDASHLAAMLDAEISANGEKSIPFIIEHYFDDTDRTLDEIQDALLALRMHGSEGAPELREPIANAFEHFAKSRRPLSGLVAKDLQAWNRWSLLEQYVEMLESGEPIYPPSRLAITNYLKAFPDLKHSDTSEFEQRAADETETF